MELLNDYNYLRAKAKHERESSKSRLNETYSNYSTPHSDKHSIITGQSD